MVCINLMSKRIQNNSRSERIPNIDSYFVQIYSRFSNDLVCGMRMLLALLYLMHMHTLLVRNMERIKVSSVVFTIFCMTIGKWMINININ